MNVQPGDRVLLPGWGGNSIKVGEEVRTLLYTVWFQALLNMILSPSFGFIRSTIYSRTQRSLLKSRNERKNGRKWEWEKKKLLLSAVISALIAFYYKTIIYNPHSHNFFFRNTPRAL